MKCAWHDSNMVDSSTEYDYENKMRNLIQPVHITLQNSGFQSVLRGFQGIREQFPWDPWRYFSNGYSDDVLLKISAELL